MLLRQSDRRAVSGRSIRERPVAIQHVPRAGPGHSREDDGAAAVRILQAQARTGVGARGLARRDPHASERENATSHARIANAMKLSFVDTAAADSPRLRALG
jgi:hypothetical protein